MFSKIVSTFVVAMAVGCQPSYASDYKSCDEMRTLSRAATSAIYHGISKEDLLNMTGDGGKIYEYAARIIDLSIQFKDLGMPEKITAQSAGDFVFGQCISGKDFSHYE